MRRASPQSLRGFGAVVRQIFRTGLLLGQQVSKQTGGGVQCNNIFAGKGLQPHEPVPVQARLDTGVSGLRPLATLARRMSLLQTCCSLYDKQAAFGTQQGTSVSECSEMLLNTCTCAQALPGDTVRLSRTGRQGG